MAASNDTRAKIRELALSVPDGTSARFKCPECSAQGTCCITRSNSEVAFICFRAMCTCRGIISSRTGDLVSKELNVIRHRKLFDGKLSSLLPEEVEWFVKKFKLRRSWLTGVRYCEEEHRVYFPQFDVMGRIHHYIARYYAPLAHGRKLKGAKTYYKPVVEGDIGLCFPNMDVLQQVVEEKRVVVVEDYPSMLRINSQIHAPTCCLGGTNIYENHISTMLALDVKELVIVLDADAIVKAVKLKRSLSLAFERVLIIPLLDADPKDMSVKELTQTLKVLL